MASLEIVDRVQPAGLPLAHIGVNAEPMIYDEGDYFGRTVNIAARIASQAGSGQVFVGEDALPHVTPSGFRLVEVGAFELKGIAKPLMLTRPSMTGTLSFLDPRGGPRPAMVAATVAAGIPVGVYVMAGTQP